MGKVPVLITRVHDVSNDGKHVELLDNTDPREPMLSTEVPKSREYRAAEALSVLGTKPMLTQKQVDNIKKSIAKAVLEINQCSEYTHPDPDSVQDPDGMGWNYAHELEYDNSDYAYERVSDSKIAAYAATYPKKKELTDAEVELQKAWNKFLLEHKDIPVEEFFEGNFTRCMCVKPSIIHNEAFCPRCHHPNPRYDGYVAVNKEGFLLTTRDMILFGYTVDDPDCELLIESDRYAASQDRIFDKLLVKIISDDYTPESVVTVRMDNTDK
jgi:hypothetical protein